MPSLHRSLTLAFSGGGAKCAAQSGALAVLEEAGFSVNGLVGVSAGGMVAVLYGLGVTPEAIRDYITNTSLLEVWEFDPTQQAIFGPDKTRARLHAITGDRTFADLKIPVIVLALDLNTGREIRLNSGRLDDALMATMAIPGFFSPVHLNGMTLVDGGALNPLPVDVARLLGDNVVAVDVLHHQSLSEPTHIFESRGPMQYAYEIGKRLRLLGMVESVYQAILHASIRMSEHVLHADPPEVMIRPAVGPVGLFAFDLAEMAYEQGRAATRAVLPQLRALVHPSARRRVTSAWRRITRRWRRRRVG